MDGYKIPLKSRRGAGVSNWTTVKTGGGGFKSVLRVYKKYGASRQAGW